MSFLILQADKLTYFVSKMYAEVDKFGTAPHISR